MFYSLRFGILMAMLAVAAVAITTVTLFVGAITYRQFDQYVQAGQELRQNRIEQALVVWGDANTVTTGIEVFGSLQFLSEDLQEDPGNFRIRTVGTIGYLEQLNEDVIGSDGEALRLELAPDGEMLVYQGQEQVGTLFVDPIPDYELEIARRDFFETINWTLVLTAFIAGLAAIMVTVLLSRRILHPVAALTLAARRMERGEFEQRVQAYAGGEIGELAQAFNAMAEAISQNERLRQNMVTDIAHELRTPLTNIRGYLEAIQDGILSADDETINMLHDEAVMLNRLIQDLQELALAEAGALQIESQELDISNSIAQSIDISQPIAHSKQIDLHADLPDVLPAVYADQRRVAQILRNLINNALTHTPPQGTICISAEVIAKEVRISVSDNGEGIASEHLPYIFERFYRADPSRSRVTGGAGLGLAIVKNLVESQGGQLSVDSTLGTGTTFTFSLPYHTKAPA
ncbi:MAG: sensor histidine kinase [Anaerolineae bacterium]